MLQEVTRELTRDLTREVTREATREAGMCEEMYGEVVDRRRQLPHIVMDHGSQYDTLLSKYQGEAERERESSEESYQHVGGGGRG